MIASKKKQSPRINDGLGVLPPQALDLEEVVLGAIMLEKNNINDVVDVLKVDSFYKDGHSKIYEAILQLFRKSEPIDLMTVTAQLRKNGTLEIAGGAYAIADLTTKVNSSANIQHHSRIILEQAMRRDLIRIASDARDMAYDQTTDVFESVGKSEMDISNIVDQNTRGSYVSYLDASKPVIDKINEHQERGLTGVPSGLASLDRATGGWQKPDLIIIAARPSVGKEQDLDSLIATPTGFTTFRDIKIGDEIIGSDGKTQFVNGYFPQGIKDVYELTFSDGTKARSGLDHLWLTSARNERRYGLPPTVKTLSQIIESGICINKDQRSNHSIKYIDPIDYDPKDYIIHPYVLGVCLGDMCFNKMIVTNPENDIYDKCRYLVIDHTTLRLIKTENRCDSFSFKDGGKRNYIFRNEIKNLGLFETKSNTKFIPEQYLFGSKEQRLELLRGLVDTDGYVAGAGSSCIEYSTTSSQLCNDVLYLVRSLGGRATFKICQGVYKKDGIHHIVMKYFRINLSFTNGIIPVSSKKHLLRYKKPKRNLEKFITSVSFYGKLECACIRVSNDDHLYATNDFILTHNSAFVGTITKYAAKAGFPVAFFSLEMSTSQLMQRFFSDDLTIPLEDIIRPNQLSQGHKYALNMAAAQDYPIYIDDTPSLTIVELKAKSRRMVQKHGIKLIIVDYLQLMIGIGQNREQEISSISRGLKAIAKELNMPVIALAQLSRAVETRGGDKKPMLSDLRDSGSIEQDADVVMFLYRPEYHGIKGENGETLENEASVIIAKHRQGRLDIDGVPLKFNGKYTRWYDDSHTGGYTSSNFPNTDKPCEF